MKRKITFLIAALFALTLITKSFMALGQEKGASNYTITFKTASNTNPSGVSTSTACSDIVSDGSSYLTGKLQTATNVYSPGTYGLKLGKSSNGPQGAIKMNLSTAGQAYVTTIVVSARQYNGNATISANDKTAQTVTNSSSAADYTFTINDNITYIQLNSSKYLWVESVTVNYTTYTVTYDCNGGTSGCPSNQTVKPGAITLADSPSRDEYIFAGWKTGSTTYLAGDSYTVSGDVTFTAQWIPATSEPTIVVTPDALTGFNYVAGSASPSAYQSFTVNGANLSDGVTVAVDASYTDNYAICKTADGTYSSSISLTESEVEAVAGVTIYVHLKTGLSAGTYNSNTITAKYDADANVKAIVTVSGSVTATHTLTISANNGVIKNGNVAMTTGSVAEGAEITVTAMPNTGYRFLSWSVSGATIGSTTANPTTFTMGTTDATLTANFEVDPTLTTYLTGSNMSSMTNAGTTYNNTKSVTTTDGFYWETNGFQYGGDNTHDPITNIIQLRIRTNKNGVSYIKLPEFNGKIEKIVFSVTDTDATSYATGGACKGVLGFQIGTTKDETVIKYDGDKSDGKKTITLNLSDVFYNTGYIVVSDGNATRIWNIEVNYLPYSSFSEEWTPGDDFEAGGTYVVTTDINTSEDITIPATAGLVVQSDHTLKITGTLTNNGTAANLIIEDGGQLICSNSVAATFKKTMSTPTKDVHGWELISSPVHDGTNSVIDVTHVTNLTTNTYDMFAYDEATHKWLNQKANTEPYSAGFSELNVGEGYMYRNNAKELSFVGNTNIATFKKDLSYHESAGDLAGFNLVGNPYSENITLLNTTLYNGDSEFGTQLSAYYVLQNNGSEWLAQTSEEISNKQGFLIQISEDIYKNVPNKIQFSRTARSASKSHGDNIKFMVVNSQFEDVTYALFDNALPLNKIDHRNPEVPMIYINQNNQNYAVATMSDDTKAFNLNFKAGTIGKYTLSYKAEGDFNYIHVIDRLTGEDVDMLLEGEYSFISAPGDNENRFIVRLGYMPNNNGTENETFAYQNGNDVIVSGEGELQVFDVTGRTVATQRVNGVETINMPSYGVYIFKLNEKVQKIVVR